MTGNQNGLNVNNETTVDPGFHRRLGFIDLAYGGKSVPEAARQMGYSSTYGYKIRHKFEEGGPMGLEAKPPMPKNFPRKIKDEIVNQLIQFALLFPNKGVHFIAKKLFEMENISISSGTIHTILRNQNLETRAKRLSLLFNRIKTGSINQLPRRAIRGMNAMSPHFKDRAFVRDRLGQHIFVWTEQGRVSNSRLPIYFNIYLDSCGSVVNIEPGLGALFRNVGKAYRNSEYIMPKEMGHNLYGPTTRIIKKFYSNFNIPVDSLCLLGDDTRHEHFLASQLEEYRIYVITLPPDEFFNVSFVRDFKRYFRKTFLLKYLRRIRHNRMGVETAGKIHQALNEFLERYNNRNIDTWPHLGNSPYGHATEKHKQPIYLPTKNNVKCKPEDQTLSDTHNGERDGSIS